MNMINDDMLKRVEKEKDRAANALAEKNSFLGIYRERVILVLTKEEVEEKIIYEEVINAIKDKRASLMSMSRSVDLKFLKKYMKLAEDNGINCKLVDAISFVGDVGLVISADDAINDNSDVVIPSIKERLKEANLSDSFYDAINTKISKKHYKEIQEKCPSILRYYSEMSSIARFFGVKDIIDEKGDK
ncbi:DUF1694 domain-containing protein [Oceanivirga miroungae]|uniref:Uncharacterized protein n=1 Tax=Oceanivirga miroungae TaxID=1130046 RepID=A0A6I8M7I0_9FUSO|nr:DUF1694 domain-containing protein [Oceanivirga miroungae]VWL84780.1 hypothetical protein OMES3154_00028 [Oceanivirga miroungae]